MKTDYGFNFEEVDEIGQVDALRYLAKAQEHVGKSGVQEVNDILEDTISILKQLIVLQDQVEWVVVDYKVGERLPKTSRQVEVVMIGDDGELIYSVDRFFGYTMLPDDDNEDLDIQCGNWEYWEEDYIGQRVIAWREIAPFNFSYLDE